MTEREKLTQQITQEMHAMFPNSVLLVTLVIAGFVYKFKADSTSDYVGDAAFVGAAVVYVLNAHRSERVKDLVHTLTQLETKTEKKNHSISRK